METTTIYWDYIGIMEKKKETTFDCRTLGLHWDNGKENGHYYRLVNCRASLWASLLATSKQTVSPRCA